MRVKKERVEKGCKWRKSEERERERESREGVQVEKRE